MKTPRRRKQSAFARARPFWIIGVFLIALLAWGLYALAAAPWFRVTRIGVDLPLTTNVTRAQVLQAAAIAPRDNIWLLHAHRIAHRIEAIPYVDGASVHRGQFPKPFVELGVTVRRPTACLTSAGRTVTIDNAARVLQEGCALPSVARIDAGTDALPQPGGFVSDPDLAQLLADAKQLADVGLVVRSLGRDRWGELEAVDAGGVLLQFGDDKDLKDKAALIGPVRTAADKARRLRAIDLRAPTTPVVRYR